MKKEVMFRGFYYVIGLLILALGLVLNTKAGLGVTPLMSISFCVSEITGMNLGNVTLIWYCVLVLIEMILHLKKENKMILLMDLLQIPLSVIFTRFLNIFSEMIPACPGEFGENMGTKVMVLILAILLTGVGAALSLNARMIPNPGDGVVKVIADTFNKKLGITKNCVDTSVVILTIITGLVLTQSVIGVGLGTICAMIGVGRVIEFFNRFVWEKIGVTCQPANAEI